MKYEEYVEKVQSIIDWFAKDHADYADAVDDLQEDLEEDPDLYFRRPFRAGYAARDAAEDIIFCADTWDEDYAIRQRERLARKYQ